VRGPTQQARLSRAHLMGESTALTGRHAALEAGVPKRRSSFAYAPPPRMFPNVGLAMRPARSVSPGNALSSPRINQLAEKLTPKQLEPPAPLTIGKALVAPGILTPPAMPPLALPPVLRDITSPRDPKSPPPAAASPFLNLEGGGSPPELSSAVKRHLSTPPHLLSSSAMPNLSSPRTIERPAGNIKSLDGLLGNVIIPPGADSKLMSPRTTSRQTTASLPPPSMRFVSVPISEAQSLSKNGTAEGEESRSNLFSTSKPVYGTLPTYMSEVQSTKTSESAIIADRMSL